MANYKELYLVLFNGITDIIETLKKLQVLCEEMYMNAEE